MGLEDIVKSPNFNVQITRTPYRWLQDRIKDVQGVSREGEPAINREELVNLLATAEESKEVRRMYERDVNWIFGQALNDVLKKRGYEPRMPDHYVYLDLPNHVMAATIRLENGKVILAYNSKHERMFKWNPLSRLYVNLHEHSHVAGTDSESYTEGMVKDAARALRGKLSSAYSGLKDRAKNALAQLAYIIENFAGQRQEAQYGK